MSVAGQLLEDAANWARALGRPVWRGRHAERALRERQQQIWRERELVRCLHPLHMRLLVSAVIPETSSTKTLRLRRLDGDPPPFRPGQYLTLSLKVDGVRTSRPLSISSSPGLPYLDVTVRAKPDGFISRYLVERATPGLELESSGPEGCFRHEPLIDGDHLVLLAGGSGITPFMSLIRDQARRDFPQQVTLLYGSRSPDDIIFESELLTIARSFPRLSCRLIISEPPPGFRGLTGLLDRQLLEDLLPQSARATFFICGPPAMVAFCSEALASLQVPRHRIRVELFGLPTAPATNPAWPSDVDPAQTFRVEVEGYGLIPARAGESLLTALERAGIALQSVCRTGACGACRCRVTHGHTFQPQAAQVREADRHHGFVHSCSAYPASNLRIRL